MKASYLLIFKLNSLFIMPLASLLACKSTGENSAEQILEGTIAYPFVRTNPLGVNGQPEKFVIRSITGGTEYIVEIPDAGKDYDIEIPMASLSSQGLLEDGRPKDLPSPANTDREITASLPDMAREAPSKTAFMDKAFGVAASDGPKQSPSYTLAIANITQLYQKKHYEYALIEVNDLLTYYPQSPRLHKMKGTIYAKLHNYALAEKSWLRALEFNPHDKILRQGIEKLQDMMRKTMLPEKANVAFPAAIGEAASEGLTPESP